MIENEFFRMLRLEFFAANARTKLPHFSIALDDPIMPKTRAEIINLYMLHIDPFLLQ